jgi:hypothetical protein
MSQAKLTPLTLSTIFVFFVPSVPFVAKSKSGDARKHRPTG